MGLVLAVATKRLQKAGPIASDEIIAIVRELSKGTFACHLKRAIQEIPLSGDAERIARDINTGRNAFVHYAPNRPAIPTYRGKDVTTDEALHMCLNDVLQTILELVKKEGGKGDG